MTQKLRRVLHDSAHDSKVPGFAVSARNRARRLRRTRRLATATAAAVAVLGLAAGYAGTQPVDVTGDSATPTPSWSDIPSRRYYTAYDDGVPSVVKTNGDEWQQTTLAIRPDLDDTWTISPDGRWWSLNDDDGLHIGPLQDADQNVRGTLPAVAELAEPSLCGPHSWSPDASRIIVGDCQSDEGALLIVDAETGVVLQRIEAPAGMSAEVMRTPYSVAVWLADGGHIVWGNYRDGFTIAGPDGGDAKPFEAGDVAARWDEAFPPEESPFDGSPFTSGISGISADGRYVCHEIDLGKGDMIENYEPIDPDETPNPPGGYCGALIDTRTGETFSPGGVEIRQVVRFSPTGEMLIVATAGNEENPDSPTTTVYLVDANNHIVEEAAETAVEVPWTMNLVGMRF